MHRTSAILVAGTRNSSLAIGENNGRLRDRHFSDDSLACAEVFGKSSLERVVERLRAADVEEISICMGSGSFLRHSGGVQVTFAESAGRRWASAGRMLRECWQRGVDSLLIAQMGAYAEFDVSAAFEFHWAKGQAATPLHDRSGPIGYWIVDPARLVAGGGECLPLVEDRMPIAPVPFLVERYVNRLDDARDMRRLVVDAFLGRCSIVPSGRQAKPGVWVDKDAQIHKLSRLVAPAYVGRNANVAAGAVITRFSNLERDTSIGQGSVIANATILPHSAVGKGLDITSALVEGNHFVHLSRNVKLKIQDPRLISGSVPKRGRVTHLGEIGSLDRPQVQPEPEYSLARAAGRLLEVFKGEL